MYLYKMKKVVLFLSFGLVVSYAYSQCCSGGVPMSGNIGLPSSEKGTWQFTANYDLNVLETLKAGSETLDDRSRRRETHAALIEAGFSINEKWSVDLFLSFVRQERTINQRGFSQDFVYTQGIGDGVLLVKYKVTPKITAGIGVKLPIGSSDRLRANGAFLNADLQPGSGAWDQVLYGSYTTQLSFRSTLTLSATGIHRFTGTNNNYFDNGVSSSTYAFGDETQFLIALADRLTFGSMIIDPSIKFRYRRAGRDFFNDAEFPASGGDFIFVNPGLSYALNPKLSYQFNVELPLFSKVTDTQLSPTVRFNTGFFVVLPRKVSLF